MVLTWCNLVESVLDSYIDTEAGRERMWTLIRNDPEYDKAHRVFRRNMDKTMAGNRLAEMIKRQMSN